MSKFAFSFQNFSENDVLSKALKKMPNLRHITFYCGRSFPSFQLNEDKHPAILRALIEILVGVSEKKHIFVEETWGVANYPKSQHILKIYRKNAHPSDAEIEKLYFKIFEPHYPNVYETVKEIVETHLKNHNAVIEKRTLG